MAKVLSSISGNLISAASAGYAPTNSADVSAIASAYQVVSATGTQLYAGTAHVTSVNGAPISASRAGNAANASMATSAWYDGTGRLISALPDSATVSAIASGYGTSKVDKSAISAQSAQWNSVYTTVNLNSASWSGSTGGGSVTSPSGTIFVKDGTAIEGTNSAVVVDQTSVGKTSILPPQGNAIGPTGMGVLTYGNLDESGMNLVFMIDGAYHGNDTTVIISGRDDNWNFASASGLIVDGDTNSNIPLGTVQSQLSASSDYWINLRYGEDLSGVKAPGYAVTGVGELAWKSAVEDVTNTAAVNSAHWGQGGVDSATVSSIASSYAQSAASSKQDSSAMSAYALSSDVSGVIDTVSSNSASWSGGGGVTFDSSFTGSGTVESPVGLSGALILACPNNTAQQIRINTGYAAGIAIKATRSSYLGSDGLTASAGSITNRTSVECANWGIRFQSGAYNKTAIIDYPAVTSYSSKSANWDDVYTTVSSNSATWGGGGGASLPITGSAGAETATYDVTSVSFVRNDTAGEPDIRTASMSPDQLQINYTYNNQDYTSMTLSESTLDFEDADGAHIVDAYSIDTWNSAVDTIANNSATWGAGGVDSATVSAIASSYAESAVSGKADSSALSSYALSADVSSTIDTVSSNSASWGQGGVDSATVSAIASSYGDSALAAATSYTDSEVSSRMYASAMQVVTSESLATATGVLYIVVS